MESAMARHRVSKSLRIDAPAKVLYAVIADYRDGHPRILPRPPFVSMTVTQGGFGAGTEIDLTMRIFGRIQKYRGIVSEPEAGRVIVERYAGTSMITSFIVDPVDDGRLADVTICTELDVGSGLAGVIGRWMATRMLRRAYAEELVLLAAVASEA
jgi:hypothetical protein